MTSTSRPNRLISPSPTNPLYRPDLPLEVGDDHLSELSPAARLPVELLHLIADHADVWVRGSLCLVNRLFNAACTESLYRVPIRITTGKALRSLTETLLQHRPWLTSLVRDLRIIAREGFWWSFGMSMYAIW